MILPHISVEGDVVPSNVTINAFSAEEGKLLMPVAFAIKIWL
jgi:hypothetical protein